MSRCGTCQVVIEGPDAVRRHYNSELHLQNVRRRVEGLRPYTTGELQQHQGSGGDDNNAFSSTVNTPHLNAGDTLSASRNQYGKDDNASASTGAMAPMFSCTLCKKTFRSVQTLQAHVRSTAHLIRKEQRILTRDADAASVLTSTSLGSAAIGLHRRHAAKMERGRTDNTRLKSKHNLSSHVNNHDTNDAATVGEGRSDVAMRAQDASQTCCLFCGHASAGLSANLAHMQRVHAFSIPMRTHCHDEPGLMDYLARKVNGLLCLVCNEKTRAFASLEALRDHMQECGHEKVVLSPEYAEFYRCALSDPTAPLQRVRRGDEMVVRVEPTRRTQIASSAKTASQPLWVGGQLVSVGNALRRSGGVGAANAIPTRVLRAREEHVPRPRTRETVERTAARKAALSAESEALAVVRREQRELQVQENRATVHLDHMRGCEFHAHQLRVNLRSNKLHPKGYDGNGVFA